MHKLEKDVSSLLNPPSNHVAIFDEMAVVRKFKANSLTFHQVADGFLRSILSMSMQSGLTLYLIFIICYQLKTQKELEDQPLHLIHQYSCHP